MKAGATKEARQHWHWVLSFAAIELVSSSCQSRSGGALGTQTSAPSFTEPAALAATTSASSESLPDVGPLLPDPERPDLDWRAALRLFEWNQAYELLRALPTEQQEQPAIRFVVGISAFESGHSTEAVSALSRLEEKLPLVREEIRAAYAKAAAIVGPFEEAALLLLGSNQPTDSLLAAEAYRRALLPVKARQAVDGAIALTERARRDSTRARLLRAELAEASGDRATALNDLRWIAKEHPEQALPLLTRIVALGGTLSFDEKLRVLEKSANAQSLDAIRTAFDELRRTAPEARARIDFAWGKALLQGRRFAEALSVLDRVALERSGVAAVEARFQAARAASRSGKESEALTRYASLARTKPPSVWTERATLRQAEILLQLGRHGEAVRAFNRYFSLKTKGAEASAAYGRALAMLGAGEPAKAREAFAALKKSAKPMDAGVLQELQGIAALRAGDVKGATALWLELVMNDPLTWASWMARARLAALGYTPLPPPIAVATPSAPSMLPLAVVMPPAAALLSSLGLDGAAERRLMAAEDELERRYAGRETEALCAVYGQLGVGRRRLQLGARAVKREVLMRAPSDAERWAWRCVYPEAFATLVEREEQLTQLPHGLVQAVMRQESAFEPTATSAVGARGLLQLMPTTAQRLAEETGLTLLPEDILRPNVNVRLGASYLKKLSQTFAGNSALMAAAYNAGPHAVNRWLAASGEGELDLWVAKIPFRETRHYVQAVMGNLLRYQFLDSGVNALEGPGLNVPAQRALGESDY